MAPRFVILALALTLTSTACAHKQEVATAARASQPPAAKPHAPKATVAHAAVVVDAPKSKEGDAIYFDFDSAILRDDARPVLQKVAERVRDRNVSLQIEGNCDELGTVEYNLALGEHRARAAQDYLVHMGVAPNRIDTVSYGSQRPKYSGHDEAARSKNRRDDFKMR
jgi:peptidoglycan-associated lipoprotein